MAANVPAQARNKKKAAKPKKGRGKKLVQIPVMQDVVFTIARLVVIATGLATSAISYLAGAGLVMSVARGAAAIFCVGILAWLICWQINHDTLETTRLELMTALEEARRKEAEERQKADEENLGTLLETQA